MSTPRLEIRDIIKSFDGRRIVDDVALTVMPGQVTCLLGPVSYTHLTLPTNDLV